MNNKLKFIVAASIVVLILLARSPSQIHLRDKLGPSSATAKSRKLPLLAPQHRGIPSLLRRQLPSPVAKVTLKRLLNSEGSSADIFEAEMDGISVPVAVKVYRNPPRGDWQWILDYFYSELEGASLFDVLDVGPKFFGVVDVGGNPAYAMELIAGVDPENLSTVDVLELITDETIRRAEEMARRIRERGYGVGDPQILIVTEDKNGHRRRDVVFVDPGSVRRFASEGEAFSDIDDIDKVVRTHLMWGAGAYAVNQLRRVREKARAASDRAVTLASPVRRIGSSL